jgi:hypothetical protein
MLPDHEEKSVEIVLLRNFNKYLPRRLFAEALFNLFKKIEKNHGNQYEIYGAFYDQRLLFFCSRFLGGADIDLFNNLLIVKSSDHAIKMLIKYNRSLQ